jgi:predicted unusual protein kinase regulating ubiquinone biosynthesis (AarF/ABC1/UbiB family)
VYKASIGNEDFVVKVRHPGVKEMIDKDLSILFGASKLIAKIPFLERFEFPATVDEFKKVLYEQTNLVKESNNLIKFTKTFKKFDDQVIFPKVRMNVLYRMIFYENFVHSDCHAGNILVQINKGKKVEKTYY